MRQPILFLLVGGLQYLLDTALFGLLLSVGLATMPANIISRASAAVIGFVLNRYLTFQQTNDTLQRAAGSLLRFIILFAVMTLLSTVSLMLLKSWNGGEWGQQIIHKLSVEAILAILSFLASKYWVFRK